MRKNLHATFIHTAINELTHSAYMIKYVKSLAKIVKEMDGGRNSYLFIYLFICLFICSFFGHRHLQLTIKILFIYEKQ